MIKAVITDLSPHTPTVIVLSLPVYHIYSPMILSKSQFGILEVEMPSLCSVPDVFKDHGENSSMNIEGIVLCFLVLQSLLNFYAIYWLKVIG